MPTSRGWLALAFGAVAIVAGRLFGMVELYIVGTALIALAVIAVGVAVMKPLRLGVGRSVTPPRLHVGSVGRVELAVRNGQSKTPVMRLTDAVQGTAGAQLLVSPLNPDEVTRAAYRLPTERRGLVSLGPVQFEATDPFGLATRRFTAESAGSLVVYPEVIPLPPAPPSPATERRSMSDTPQFLGGRSEEFHALRPYVPGDDVRRINWAATARHDDLVVREDEAPTQNHLTVFLDNASLPSLVAVDRAATVAASLISSMRNRADPFRLMTSDGQDTNFVLGASGVEQSLSVLAVVEPTERPKGAAIPTNSHGAIVVVSGPTSTLDRSELGAFGRVLFLTLDEAVWDENAPDAASVADVAGGQIRLRLGSIDDLASLWTRSITTLLSSASGR